MSTFPTRNGRSIRGPLAPAWIDLNTLDIFFGVPSEKTNVATGSHKFCKAVRADRWYPELNILSDFLMSH